MNVSDGDLNFEPKIKRNMCILTSFINLTCTYINIYIYVYV